MPASVYIEEIIMNLKDYDAGRRAIDGTHNLKGKIEYLEQLKSDSEELAELKLTIKKVKFQLNIKKRHARRDGDYDEASAYHEALDLINTEVDVDE